MDLPWLSELMRRVARTLRSRSSNDAPPTITARVRYELFFGITTEIILFSDQRTLRILDANDAASRAYGYSRNELRTLTVADLRMDVQHRRVTRAGRLIALSPREFDVLQVLMQEPGRAFSRTELCERVWQRDHEYDTRTVEIFITRLRKKVDSGFGAPLIHTLRGIGYTIRAAD